MDRAEKIMEKVRVLTKAELRSFHELYQLFLKEKKEVRKLSGETQLKDVPKDELILGKEYNFWLNDKDEVYDELYKDEV